jgi:hypothetical protein
MMAGTMKIPGDLQPSRRAPWQALRGQADEVLA